jgi:hypothetical protein
VTHTVTRAYRTIALPTGPISLPTDSSGEMSAGE